MGPWPGAAICKHEKLAIFRFAGLFYSFTFAALKNTWQNPCYKLNKYEKRHSSIKLQVRSISRYE